MYGASCEQIKGKRWKILTCQGNTCQTGGTIKMNSDKCDNGLTVPTEVEKMGVLSSTLFLNEKLPKNTKIIHSSKGLEEFIKSTPSQPQTLFISLEKSEDSINETENIKNLLNANKNNEKTFKEAVILFKEHDTATWTPKEGLTIKGPYQAKVLKEKELPECK
jgi:hypothetical protein